MESHTAFFLATQFLFLNIGLTLAHQPHIHTRYTHLLLICTGILSAYGLLQSLGLDVLPAKLVFQQAGRITATFENPNYFGNAAACALPLSAGLFVYRTDRRSMLYLLLAALLYTGVLLSGSRGAWAAALFGATISVAGLGRSTRPIIRTAILILVFILVTIGFSNRPVLKHAGKSVAVGERLLSSRLLLSKDQQASRTVSQQSLSHRRWIWRRTWDMVRTGPLFGHGLGQFETAFAIQHPQSEPSSTAFENAAFAHNEWLHIAAETGLPGALGFSLLIFGLLYHIFQTQIKNNSPVPHNWGFLGCVTVVLFHSLISYPLHLPLSSLIFWATLGLLSDPIRPPGTRHENM